MHFIYLKLAKNREILWLLYLWTFFFKILIMIHAQWKIDCGNIAQCITCVNEWIDISNVSRFHWLRNWYMPKNIGKFLFWISLSENKCKSYSEWNILWIWKIRWPHVEWSILFLVCCVQTIHSHFSIYHQISFYHYLPTTVSSGNWALDNISV